MPRTILAVAAGETATADNNLNTAAPDFRSVRPYVKGLFDWLNTAPANRDKPPQPDNNPPQYSVPGDYSIVYRERPVDDLQPAFQDNIALQADLWLCMSTSVARAADTVAKARNWSNPIVAIVSDPFSETFGNNVCGVSANRDRLARRCYKEFRKRVSAVKNVFILHRASYKPSERALQWLGKKGTLVSVADGDDIKTKIDNEIIAPSVPNKGVLVLPADRFFAFAVKITQWTGNIPTFWSTRDFPSQARGGWGFEQGLCGGCMAERVATIWKNQTDGVAPLPDPKWWEIDHEWVTGRP